MLRRVVAAGTFDGIHPGHQWFLTQARALGNELAVIVARDQTVARVKGHRPRRSEHDRLAAIRAEPTVDRAELGSTGADYLGAVIELAPAVLALGYDQWPDEAALAQALADRGLPTVQIVRLGAFEPDRYHSSVLQRTEDRGQKTD